MSKLADLVPPLELCKLIPKGEFEESYAINVYICGEWLLMPVDDCASDIKEKHSYYPAPTLEEIMAKLPPYAKNEHILACCVPDWADFNARIFGEHWRVGYTGDASINDKSPSTAALKLWLKFKGIDVQNSAEIEQ